MGVHVGFCPCPTNVLIVSKIHRSRDSQTTMLTSTGSQAGLYLSKTSLPWRRKWQPTPVFLPGKSHGQRILAGYSPRGRKELNMTERLNHGPSITYGDTKEEICLRTRKWGLQKKKTDSRRQRKNSKNLSLYNLKSESESHSVMSCSFWPHGLYTVHGILQARILEWAAFPFSRGSSQPRDWTQVSHIAGRFFTS